MANTKISALTSASTPLAGTEVLPIVQSSATVKVATNDLTVRNFRANATTGILQVTGPAAASTRVMTVPDANFTAARTDAAQSFTGDQTLSTGNLVIGTSGKGIDFSATPGTGTSELLADYEEGTWTPTLTPTTSGTITLNTSIDTMRYTKIGSVVFVQGRVQATSVSSPLGAIRFSLPFAVADLAEGAGIAYLTCTMDGAVSANVSDFVSETSEGNSYATIYLGSSTTWQGTSAQQVQTNTYVYLSGSYVAS
jgi:hypothetical protein